ncbi:MAG: hypothetical protein ACP5Q1_05475, partial [Anaerolineae bacterium]
ISRRYSPSQILAEASPIFPNTIVAKDLDRFRLTRASEREQEQVEAKKEEIEDERARELS